MKVTVKTNPEGIRRVRTLAQALGLPHADMAGPVLVELGVVHRKQENRIFATQGSAGASGRWPALSPGYAAKKRKQFPGKKILQRTGDMKARLTKRSNPNYYQDYVPRSAARGTFRFGARSGLAAAHRAGTGPLPIRDMLTKTAAQVAEFQAALFKWYREKRAPQAFRNYGPPISQSRPR